MPQDVVWAPGLSTPTGGMCLLGTTAQSTVNVFNVTSAAM
jgi:hypothetical protein